LKETYVKEDVAKGGSKKEGKARAKKR